MNKKIASFLLTLLLTCCMLLPANTYADNTDLTIVGKQYQLPSNIKVNESNTLGKTYENHYITIKMHAGENGYFGEPGVTTRDSIQFRGEAFSDKTIPSNTDENMVFVGWTTDPESVDPNIIVGSTHASMIGSDIYAIWTDKCIVDYSVINGQVEIDGDMVNRGVKEYNKGDTFENLIPVNYIPDVFAFRGWYYDFGGESILVPEGMILDKPNLSVFSKWSYIPENIPNMVVGTKYHHDVDKAGVYYKFTSPETKVYELFFDLIDGDTQNTGNIEIYDKDNNKIRDHGNPDDDGNAKLTYTMLAGETYYINFRGSFGGRVEFEAGIRETDYRTVTFHSNRDEQGDAYFDDDESKLITTIPFSIGEEISHYRNTGLSFKDENKLEFIGWSLDPNETRVPLDKIEVTDNIDVYGIYYDLDSITLDANGGYYSLLDGDTELVYDYKIGTAFDPPFNPQIDDVSIKFAGWSRNPNATEPDEDILEEITMIDSLPKTLYAVYTEKILETWDADAENGGYFLSDPSITTYESTKGKGHIFYGLTLYNANERLTPLGFEDQDGEFIPYTTLAYPFYHNKGDTTYKAVWGYKVVVDCNGGYLPLFDEDRMRLAMPINGKFDLQYVFDSLGYPVMDGDENINKYVIGFATSPNATEPDIIDGETDISDLDVIYAVWSDDEYYFVDGDNSTWTKDSTEGATFTIKRKGYDIDTYSSFTNLKIDNEIVQTDNYKRKQGSLILTINPDYLNNLSTGKHNIVFTFAGDTKLETSLIINEVKVIPDSNSNPVTGDNIKMYVIVLAIGIIGLLGIIVFKKKK